MRVDRVLQLKNLALHVDSDLFGQVAIGNRRRHLRDIADLPGQIPAMRLTLVGEILPGPGDALDPRLPAELPLGYQLLARHASLPMQRSCS